MRNLIYLNQCTSTNDIIVNHLPMSCPDIFGIYTYNQTSGKGQYGNQWIFQEDKNLALSIALKNTSLLRDSFINFHTAVLVRNFIAKLTNLKTEIKWPNDIILEGKKISGILLEKKKIHQQEYFVIGIGLNVLQADFQNYPKAGSLYTQSGKLFSLEMIAEKLFDDFIESLQSPIDEKVVEDYNKYLFKKNKVAVFGINKSRQNGIIEKVDASGYLWVNLENDGLRKFFNKEIELFY